MNKFLSPLSIPEGKSGEWEVSHRTVAAGIDFHTANFRSRFFGGQRQQKIVFEEDTTWHYLKEDGYTWMSDLPIEHAQMRDCVKNMRGKILIGGLGLGLAPTILAAKRSIREIVVVELSKDVINLVAPHTANSKVTIVNEDLFEYLRNLKVKNRFDHAMYDIWQSDGEGTFFEVVQPLSKLSVGLVRCEPVCWNENVMRGQLCQSLQHTHMFMLPEVKERFSKELSTLKFQAWEFDGTNKPWHNWKVPFFQWIKERNPEDKMLAEAMSFYAGWYGRWGGECMWDLFVRDCRVR